MQNKTAIFRQRPAEHHRLIQTNLRIARFSDNV